MLFCDGEDDDVDLMVLVVVMFGLIGEFKGVLL